MDFLANHGTEVGAGRCCATWPSVAARCSRQLHRPWLNNVGL